MIGHYNGFGFDFELPGLTGPGRLSLTVGAPATGTSVEIGATATSVAPQTVDAGFNLSPRIPNFRPPSVRLPGRVYTQTGAPGAADPNAGDLVGPSTPPVEKKSNMMLYAGAGVAAVALLLLLRRK